MVDLQKAIVIVIVYDFYFINKIRYFKKQQQSLEITVLEMQTTNYKWNANHDCTQADTVHTNVFLIDQKVCCGFLNYANTEKL